MYPMESMSKSRKNSSSFTKNAPGNQPRLQLVKALYKKSVILTDWWLIEVESKSKGKRLGVAGRPSRERLVMRDFKSTAIIKRHDRITLETEDGISITITNGINMLRTLQNGFPREVCNHFLSGFPYDWKEFPDKRVGEKSTSSITSDVNDVASSIGHLPVAHVRDILMLNSGDSARSLIEKCISCHIPRKQEDCAEKDDLNCAKKEAKRKRQEDDVYEIRYVAGDLSDDATSRAKSASIDSKNATTHKDDDTCENSRLASDYFSNDATLKTQDPSKVEENSYGVNGDLSDDAIPRTPKTNKIEGKSDDKVDSLCPTDLIKDKTPKVKVKRSNHKNSSKRVTRSMSSTKEKANLGL